MKEVFGKEKALSLLFKKVAHFDSVLKNVEDRVAEDPNAFSREQARKFTERILGPGYQITRQDIDDLMVLCGETSDEDLEWMWGKLQKNTRLSKIIRAINAASSPFVIKAVYELSENGDLSIPLAVAVAVGAAAAAQHVLSDAFDYFFRNENQQYETIILSAVIAEIIKKNASTLSVSGIPPESLDMYPRELSSAIARAQRSRNVSFLETVEVVSISSSILALLNYQFEAAVYALSAMFGSVASTSIYRKFGPAITRENHGIDQAIQNSSNPERTPFPQENRDSWSSLSKVKLAINILAGVLPNAGAIMAVIAGHPVSGALIIQQQLNNLLAGSMMHRSLAHQGSEARRKLRSMLRAILDSGQEISSERLWTIEVEKRKPLLRRPCYTEPNAVVISGLQINVADSSSPEGERMLLRVDRLPISRGRITVIRGGNGQGKSSFLKHLTKMNAAADLVDQVHVTDKDGRSFSIYELTFDELRRQFVYISAAEYKSDLPVWKVCWPEMFFDRKSELYQIFRRKITEAFSPEHLSFIHHLLNNITLRSPQGEYPQSLEHAIATWIKNMGVTHAKYNFSRNQLKLYEDVISKITKAAQEATVEFATQSHRIFSREELESIILRSPMMGVSMSNGQRVRVGILELLAKSGMVVAALDEPFAALDPDNRQAVVDSLAELAQSGVAVIVNSHESSAELGELFGRAGVFRDLIEIRERKVARDSNWQAVRSEVANCGISLASTVKGFYGSEVQPDEFQLINEKLDRLFAETEFMIPFFVSSERLRTMTIEADEFERLAEIFIILSESLIESGFLEDPVESMHYCTRLEKMLGQFLFSCIVDRTESTQLSSRGRSILVHLFWLYLRVFEDLEETDSELRSNYLNRLSLLRKKIVEGIICSESSQGDGKKELLKKMQFDWEELRYSLPEAELPPFERKSETNVLVASCG